MIYVDTSVVLVYTLTQAVERARYQHTEKFFAKVAERSLLAATSFYALHEVYIFAIENAPNFQTGAAFGKAALEKILALPVLILPLVTREERTRHARLFYDLKDASDVPHAIAAFVYGCDAIVAYDEHFRAITNIIRYTPPEHYL